MTNVASKNAAAVSPYLGQIERCLDRARGFVDRDHSSPSFGSCDRAFWYYRTIVDFPGAAWQQLMLGFSALATNEALSFTEREQLACVARATLARWSAIQHRDGSFDEWYRNERSYCATAFTAAGAAQSLLLLGNAVPDAERQTALAALERAARWLSSRFHPTVMNQNLAAALALWCTSRLTNADVWRAAAEAHYARLKAEQSSEGWFPEYGGADLGYSTLALDLLAGAHGYGFLGAAEMATPLARFILGNVAENFCLPGRLGSRGTSHCFVYGAEYFGLSDEAAAQLACGFRDAHRERRVQGPESVDDRYFAYFYFPQFALAASVDGALPSSRSPRAMQSANYDNAGLRVTRVNGASVHASRHLGGAVALAVQGRSFLYHLGYSVSGRNGRRYATAIWSENKTSDRADEYNAGFREVVDEKPLEHWSPLFALFTRLLAIPGLASLFSTAIKARMIRGSARFGGELTRRLTIGEDFLEIRDTIVVNRPDELATLSLQTEIGVHSPSARFEPLRDASGHFAISESDIVTLRRSGKVELTYLIKLSDALA